MLKSALKGKRKRGRRNSLMANNFSKELDRVIVTATLYRPSFTNPFEKRHGIAAKRVSRVHGANLAWTIGGGRSITETSSGRSVVAPSATSMHCARGPARNYARERR